MLVSSVHWESFRLMAHQPRVITVLRAITRIILALHSAKNAQMGCFHIEAPFLSKIVNNARQALTWTTVRVDVVLPENIPNLWGQTRQIRARTVRRENTLR